MPTFRKSEKSDNSTGLFDYGWILFAIYEAHITFTVSET